MNELENQVCLQTRKRLCIAVMNHIIQGTNLDKDLAKLRKRYKDDNTNNTGKSKNEWDKYTAEKLAQIKKISNKELINLTSKNFNKLFS